MTKNLDSRVDRLSIGNWSQRERLNRLWNGPRPPPFSIDDLKIDPMVIIGALLISSKVAREREMAGRVYAPPKTMNKILHDFDLPYGAERSYFLKRFHASSSYVALVLEESHYMAQQYGLVDNYSYSSKERKEIFKALAISVHLNGPSTINTIIEKFGIESIPGIMNESSNPIPKSQDKYVLTEIGGQHCLLQTQDFNLLTSIFGRKLKSKRGMDHLYMMGYESLEIKGGPTFFYQPGT